MPSENDSNLSQFYAEISASLAGVGTDLETVFDQIKQRIEAMAGELDPEEFSIEQTNEDGSPMSFEDFLSQEISNLLKSLGIVFAIAGNLLDFLRSQLTTYEKNRRQLSLQSKGNKSESFSPIALQTDSDLQKTMHNLSDQLNNIASTIKGVFERITHQLDRFFHRITAHEKQQAVEMMAESQKSPATASQNQALHAAHKHNQYVEFMKHSLITLMMKVLDGINNGLDHALHMTHQMQDNLSKSNNPDQSQAEQLTVQQVIHDIAQPQVTDEARMTAQNAIATNAQASDVDQAAANVEAETNIATMDVQKENLLTREHREAAVIHAENVIDNLMTSMSGTQTTSAIKESLNAAKIEKAEVAPPESRASSPEETIKPYLTVPTLTPQPKE